MAQWDLNTARTSLRSLLADNDGDKYEFRVPAYPMPDGIARVFALGRSNVAESVGLTLNNTDLIPQDIDFRQGLVTFADPPSPSGTPILASFGFQWWTDAQLDEFLQASVQLLTFEDVPGVAAVGLRPVVLDFAMYHAYMWQAAQNAEEVVVSAGGYTAQQSRTHPNWRALAEMAFGKAQIKLKLYLDGALGAATPALAFTAFRICGWQPK